MNKLDTKQLHTCLNVRVLIPSFWLLGRDSGTTRMMKTTSRRATMVAKMTTIFSFSKYNSSPAPKAGDIIRDAAKPAVTRPYPRERPFSSVTSATYANATLKRKIVSARKGSH